MNGINNIKLLRNGISVRFKIIFITIAIFFLAISIYTAIISFIFSKENYKIAQTTSYILAQNLNFQLEKLIKLGLKLDEIDGFDKQCEDLVKKYKTISYAIVVNSSGDIIFSFFDEINLDNDNFEYTKIKNPKIVQFINKNSQITRNINILNKDYNEVYIPIYDSYNNYIGAVGIGFEHKIILKKIQFLLFVSFFISIILIIVAIFLLVITLSKWVTNPIKNLVSVIQEIRSKNILDKKVEIITNDELGKLAIEFNRMIEELDENRIILVEKNRIEKELEIAKIIQTSILPKNINIPGYQIIAYMKPANEVGGDYYDVVMDKNKNYWVNIGDVTGHGVSAGLIMIMLQSVFLTAVSSNNTNISPDLIYNNCNNVIYNNIKNRLFSNQFITSCFLKCNINGQIEYAGAHEHILIYRENTKNVDIIPTQGIWLGIMEDISHIVKVNKLELNKNDVLFLYTDGLIQLKNSENQQYSLERFVDFIKENGSLPLEEINQKLLDEIDNFKVTQDDDITFIILKKD
jgi:serine phosphatase RsbU (regulator of sigma subunit)